MFRLLEKALNLEPGFFRSGSEFSLRFAPHWPFQEKVGAMTWNLALALLAVALVVWVYRREGRSRGAKIVLGSLRLLLLAFVIAMLNRPSLARLDRQYDPSVIAVLLDGSGSMEVKDVVSGGASSSRFELATNLLTGENAKLLKELAGKHNVRIYRFDSDSQELDKIVGDKEKSGAIDLSHALLSVGKMKPDGETTRVFGSLRTVLHKLQGEHLAGVIVLTDGRDNPEESQSENVAAIRKYGRRIYPVAIGSDAVLRNVEVDNVIAEKDAFIKDIINTKVRVRATGYPEGHQITVVLKDEDTGQPLKKATRDNRLAPAQETIVVGGGGSATTQPSNIARTGDVYTVEINFKAPERETTLHLIAEALPDPQEITLKDNVCRAQIEVLDAHIRVLFCDGYPRWDYRYLKDTLIRDNSVDVACLLFSADTGFKQEGDAARKPDPSKGDDGWPGPVTRFPENMTEMLMFDVVIFGDVDSRQFTDPQLQLVTDFVLKKHGGFGMIAGPKYAPYSFRGSPIEDMLPVNIRQAAPEEKTRITGGWRPMLTPAGQDSMIYRFFEDRRQNEDFLKNELQPLFWYCRGITPKRDIGEVYAMHPPDGGDPGGTPILVLGRYGGRTLFSGIDDSWRWRFYTGESIFDTYWVQQLRYLAREKKLGQRRFTLEPARPAYERGEQVEVRLNILDPDLLRNPPASIPLKINRVEHDGVQVVRQPQKDQVLESKPGQKDVYITSWRADSDGDYEITADFAGKTVKTFVRVKATRTELSEARLDLALLRNLLPPRADDNEPKEDAPDVLRVKADADLAAVREALAEIPAIDVEPRAIPATGPLWDAPLALILFVLLITAEWVLRKMYGML